MERINDSITADQLDPNIVKLVQVPNYYPSVMTVSSVADMKSLRTLHNSGQVQVLKRNTWRSRKPGIRT
jgi:hypothetical protein